MTSRRTTTMRSMMMIKPAVVFLCVLTLRARADCPPAGCGPYGTCHKDTRSCGDLSQCETTCKCDIGYDGADCSLRAITCPDDIGPNGLRTCFNGGICAEREVYDDSMRNGAWSEWYCDCRDAVGSAGNPKIHVGHQCEFPIQNSCIKGQHQSNYAFCVNNGACKRRVDKGEDHPGCLCVGGYAGRHCQYRKGTVPHDELVLEAYLDGVEDEGLGGFGIFLICMLAIGFVGGMGYLIFENMTRSNKEVDTNDPSSSSAATPTDLRLEDQGNSAAASTEVI